MEKKKVIAITIAVIIVFIFIGGNMFTNIFNRVNSKESAVTIDTQVNAQDVAIGTGAVATAGKSVTVHYTGVFADGRKFDSSRDRGVPFTFKLGTGQVIKGWDLGVEGMKVGGKRLLVIPPQFGYGSQDLTGADGSVIIPGNSTLVFEVELLEVK